jgi:hypothetical protein
MRPVIGRNACRALWLLALIWLLPGCSSPPKIDWDSRIGNYTYDQAVQEMGPAENESTLSDGSKVGDWFVRRGPTTSVGVGMGMGGGYSTGGVGVGVGRTSSTQFNHYLRLTFDPAAKLVRWENITR